jgi:hypothetical protein
MTLDECREIAGTLRAVCYYPFPGARPEYGEVVRCSSSAAFVLYDGDRAPKATRPEDLHLATQAPA